MASVRAWLTTPSTARDVTCLSVIVALLFLLTGSHGAYGSSNRYAESCREMVELGQWTVPHLGYVPYFEKPILTYWLGAASQWLFGGGDMATNLPAGLAALVSVLATYGLGCRLRGSTFGLAAALFLLTSGMFSVMASVLTTDPILSACLAVVWLGIWCWDENRVEGKRWLWGFWVALALGFLSKGPIAIVLAGAAIAGYAFLCGGMRGVFTTLWAMCPLRGTAILLAINLPWSWAVWQRDPRFLEFFYVRVNFQAFFNGEINHPGPWWYYAPILAAYMWPYALVAMPALVLACWRIFAPAVTRMGSWAALSGTQKTTIATASRARLFLASVVIFPLIFLSISASKLGTYPMPLLPAIMLLALDLLWVAPAHERRWWNGILIGQSVVLVLGLICAPLILMALMEVVARQQPIELNVLGFGVSLQADQDPGVDSFNWTSLPLALTAVITLAVSLLWSGFLAVRGRTLAALSAVGVGLLLVVIVLLPRVKQLVMDLDDSRLMRVVMAHGGPQDPVITTQETVHYYELTHTLGRRLHAFGHTRELGMGFFAQVEPTAPFPREPYHVDGDSLPQHPWLYSTQRLAQDWRGAQRLWLVGSPDIQAQLEHQGLTVHVIERIRNTVLFSNQSLPAAVPVVPVVPAGPVVPVVPVVP